MASLQSADKSSRHEGTQDWVHITDKKSFSRLLYTNPVCFLTAKTKLLGNVGLDNMVTTSTPTTKPCGNHAKSNVMVVSWLTPTDNSGNIILSVNRNRHTLSLLSGSDDVGAGEDVGLKQPTSKTEVALSVPVAGMEQLVLNVGKTSGRWGSKFPEDHTINKDFEETKNDVSVVRKKTMKRRRFCNGVDGLYRTKIGTSDLDFDVDEVCNGKVSLFAIRGTVAHMKCRVDGMLSNNEVVKDDSNSEGTAGDHSLIMAHIYDAYVHSDYWNDKRQFRPIRDDKTIPPYLTFFGSQTFGYTLPDYKV